MAEQGRYDDVPDNGLIRVTNRELYDMMQEVRDRVFAVETKLDIVFRDNEDVAKRVRALELRFYGILAGVIGALAIVIQQVAK